MITKYRGLSNEEFLNEIASIKEYSPIISELVSRLENMVEPILNPNIECPCCEANLLIDPDSINEVYDVRLNKEI